MSLVIYLLLNVTCYRSNHVTQVSMTSSRHTLYPLSTFSYNLGDKTYTLEHPEKIKVSCRRRCRPHILNFAPFLKNDNFRDDDDYDNVITVQFSSNTHTTTTTTNAIQQIWHQKLDMSNVTCHSPVVKCHLQFTCCQMSLAIWATTWSKPLSRHYVTHTPTHFTVCPDSWRHT